MEIIISLLVIEIILILILINILNKKKYLGVFSLRLLGEFNNMLKFTVVLPQKSASDVVARELKVSVGDNEEQIFGLDGDVNESTEFFGSHNDKVSGALVDIDSAGNRSSASIFDLVLLDTIAPPQPGEVGLRVFEDNVNPVDPVEPVE